MVSANVLWRWVFSIGVIYQGLVTIAIFLFAEETSVSPLTSYSKSKLKNSLYDRKLSPVPKPNTHGIRLRLETLTGITGIKLRKYRMSMTQSIVQPALVFIRPNMLLMSIYIA